MGQEIDFGGGRACGRLRGLYGDAPVVVVFGDYVHDDAFFGGGGQQVGDSCAVGEAEDGSIVVTGTWRQHKAADAESIWLEAGDGILVVFGDHAGTGDAPAIAVGD